MSNGYKALELKSDDARKILAAKMHLGSTNCKYQMKQYVFKRNDASGAHVFDINKMWEKIMLAARIIAAVDNAQDVCIVSAKDLGQRAIIKFAKFIGGTPVNGRFSPGTFTNHSQAGFREPRLIIVTDPVVDHQAIREASYVNIPTIGLCDADTPVKYIDCVIPCNNRAPHSIGLVYWLLAREVQRLRGTLSRSEEWSIMPDLFFYRNLEEIKKQEEEELKAEADAAAIENMPADEEGFTEQWGGEDTNAAAQPTEDWNAQQPPAGAQDWTAEPAAQQDWAQAPEAAAGW